MTCMPCHAPPLVVRFGSSPLRRLGPKSGGAPMKTWPFGQASAVSLRGGALEGPSKSLGILAAQFFHPPTLHPRQPLGAGHQNGGLARPHRPSVPVADIPLSLVVLSSRLSATTGDSACGVRQCAALHSPCPLRGRAPHLPVTRPIFAHDRSARLDGRRGSNPHAGHGDSNP